LHRPGRGSCRAVLETEELRTAAEIHEIPFTACQIDTSCLVFHSMHRDKIENPEMISRKEDTISYYLNDFKKKKINIQNKGK
jgi:hypothetical protein